MSDAASTCDSTCDSTGSPRVDITELLLLAASRRAAWSPWTAIWLADRIAEALSGRHGWESVDEPWVNVYGDRGLLASVPIDLPLVLLPEEFASRVDTAGLGVVRILFDDWDRDGFCADAIAVDAVFWWHSPSSESDMDAFSANELRWFL